MRAGLEYSHRGRGLGASRTLPRLGCRQAGSRSRGARAGRARRAQHFKFRSGSEVAREPSCGSLRAGRPAPAREGRVRGAVRGLTTWAPHSTQLGSRRSGPGREPFGPADRQHFRRSFYIASTSGLLPVRVPRCYLRTLKLFVAAQSTWHWAPFPGAWQPRFQRCPYTTLYGGNPCQYKNPSMFCAPANTRALEELGLK